MKKLLLGVGLYVAALLIFLIASVPAHFALRFLPPHLPLQLNGVEGTVWRGLAQDSRWQGQSLGQLQWRLHVLPLLLARIKTEFTLRGDGLLVDGTASVDRNRRIDLRDTRIEAKIDQLPLARDRLLAVPSGQLAGRIERAEIMGNWFETLAANLDWDPAALTAPLPVELGAVHVDLVGTAGNLDGTLTSRGPLETQGGFKLTRSGRLTTDITLRPTAQTPQDLKDVLPMLGKPGRDGAIRIKQALQLPGLPL